MTRYRTAEPPGFLRMTSCRNHPYLSLSDFESASKDELLNRPHWQIAGNAGQRAYQLGVARFGGRGD
jgi:hypothetical protein